ncbi:PREDICTED: uncharacterized protein LOC108561686 [Nicrophorus vespilloides]|uniref:Uncharacterized protein LOC108561686 n=1 Tax=Nicrophorus vespilloides TaxID=110193 RepID=A0ABM1MKY6_NICVS|nr:PREDICTED: uncharacterized protein LOC108561686 [Nicrophorus vespilloides]
MYERVCMVDTCTAVACTCVCKYPDRRAGRTTMQKLVFVFSGAPRPPPAALFGPFRRFSRPQIYCVQNVTSCCHPGRIISCAKFRDTAKTASDGPVNKPPSMLLLHTHDQWEPKNGLLNPGFLPSGEERAAIFEAANGGGAINH